MFAFFQALTPMIGWICIHTVLQYFKTFEILIPWIGLILLCFIGTKMILESKKESSKTVETKLTFSMLTLQSIATSIDALSVGFTISNYNLISALCAATIIGIITFIICICGILIGKKMGTKLAGKADIFGGIILIFIGLEIFISNFFI